jgi:uncharacterized protein
MKRGCLQSRRMSQSDQPNDSLRAVPIFALPNVVLFPGAVLPLHIFEERYKAMTRDALRSDKRVAMALLKPGWEKNYYQRPAIEPVVCVGRILAHEKLDDGTYNFLLQGEERARILCEVEGKPYREAQVQPLQETPVMEIDLSAERQRLITIFSEPALAQLGIAKRFHEILSSPLHTAQVADLVAFNFLDDVCLKQSLLSETDVTRRVVKTIAALEGLRPALAAAAMRGGADPSMN